MNTPLLPRRVPREPAIGEKVAFSRTFTEADASLFIGVTWDVNPYHTDDSYVAATRFKRRILPGLLTASMQTHLGGLWAFLATEMKFKFTAPVYIGETITAESEVIHVDESSGRVTLRCRCKNAAGDEVLAGEVIGFPGRHES